MEKRVISTELFEEENRTENSLRPKLLSDYIGQAKAKEKLKIYIEAAKARGESLGPCAFVRASRTGKDDACRDYCQ